MATYVKYKEPPQCTGYTTPMRRLFSITVIGILLVPAVSSAQVPSGCHVITTEEIQALTLRGAPIPTTGFFCDADKAILFGSCTTDPLPVLIARYTPGPTSQRDGQSGVTKLNPEFACRLSRYVTAFPNTCIVSAYRSNETQKILWDEALKKYGTEAEARKWVAPPGSSRHNTGLAADLCNVSEAARTAAPTFGLLYRLEYEPWHIEANGVDVTPAPSYQSVLNQPAPVSSSASYLTLIGSIASLSSSLLSSSAWSPVTETPYLTIGTAGTSQNANAMQIMLGTSTFSLAPGTSMADYLLALLQGENSASLLSPLVIDSAATGTPTSTAATTEEELRKALMLQLITLLATLLDLLRNKIL